ncbi:MAG TPA: hypothetical protein VFV86_04265 [Nitrososphaeraceae archaeon]|nr:hypothetical protein [Nitrososphaeraceae archaeon]
MVEAIADIKQIEGVGKVLWSEEVFKFPVNRENIMKSFKKYWSNNKDYQKK